jgi:uncharacterized protein YecE (DUF72 family)
MPLWIGTSGWQYADWRGPVYPPELRQTDWLRSYASRFRTVELNASFYRLPARTAFASWALSTPADMVIAVKASRYLTHMKRLREPEEPVTRLMDRALALGSKLGPLLVQLPPNFTVDAERLATALDRFPTGVRVAVELRHGSWFTEAVRRVLSDRNAALVLADRRELWLTPQWRTADWGYVRFHEGEGQPRPCYRGQTLRARARELADCWTDDADCFVYFNNDPRACAVRDAAVFAEAWRALGRTVTRAPRPDDTVVVGP